MTDQAPRYVRPSEKTKTNALCPNCESNNWYETGSQAEGYTVICRDCSYTAPPEYFWGLIDWPADSRK